MWNFLKGIKFDFDVFFSVLYITWCHWSMKVFTSLCLFWTLHPLSHVFGGGSLRHELKPHSHNRTHHLLSDCMFALDWFPLQVGWKTTPVYVSTDLWSLLVFFVFFCQGCDLQLWPLYWAAEFPKDPAWIHLSVILHNRRLFFLNVILAQFSSSERCNRAGYHFLAKQ